MRSGSITTNKLAWKFGAKLILKRPATALKYASSFLGRKKTIARLTMSPLAEVERCYKDIHSNKILYSHLEDELAGSFYGQNMFGASELYAICRLLKPKAVLETGVAAGYSSAFILQALQDNEFGHLYSIDIGKTEFDDVTLPAGREIGWLVPSSLRRDWTLKIGASSQILKPLLDQVGEISVFYHDSEHSYRNMTFEFETVWRHLTNPGILLADNADWNTSFADFCKRRGLKVLRVMLGLWGARKEMV